VAAVSKEASKNRLNELVNQFNQCAKTHYTEQDTITIFILPLLELLGWNIHNVYEVKQRSFPFHVNRSISMNFRSPKHPDCVISLNKTPHMVLEFKPLNYGQIDKYCQIVADLLEKAYYVGAKFAVLTSFAKMNIYDGMKVIYDEKWDLFYDNKKVYDAPNKTYNCEEIQPLMRFNNPEEYGLKYDALWTYLSKENAVK